MHESLPKYEQQQAKPKEKGTPTRTRVSRNTRRATAKETQGKGKPTCTKVSQNTSSSNRNQRKREARMHESLAKYEQQQKKPKEKGSLHVRKSPKILPIASSTLPQAFLSSCRTLRKNPFGVFRMFFVIDYVSRGDFIIRLSPSENCTHGFADKTTWLQYGMTAAAVTCLIC